MAQSPADAQAARSAVIVAHAAQDVTDLWPKVDWESPHAPNAVATVYGAIVAEYGRAAAAVAAEQYDELRAAAGAPGKYIAAPADAVPQAAIDKAVASAFLGRDGDDRRDGSTATTADLPVELRVPKRLEESLSRRVLQPARDTVAQNVARDPAKTRYIRVPRGKSTCAFCILLASRDIGPQFRGYSAHAVRTDPETGKQYLVDRNGERYHNGCDCEAVPLFGQPPDLLSPHIGDYRDLYERAVDEAGTARDLKAILAAMRRLDTGDAYDEDKPDVRDRAGEGNRRARPIEVSHDPDQHEDEAQPPEVADGQNLDVAPHAVADELDAIEDQGDDFGALPEPAPEPTSESAAESAAAELDKPAKETKLERALRELNEAIDAGDDERVLALSELAEKLETAAAKQAERRQAAANALQDRIFELIEAGEDPQHAETEVMMSTSTNMKKVQKLLDAGHHTQEEAEREVYNETLKRIRIRDFMAQARAEGFTGKSFEDLLGLKFDRIADEQYLAAEDATRGQMVKRTSEGKFDYRRFWYVNEATARKHMSDELAAWFDQHGRITKAIYREMILDGDNTFDRHREDYLQ
ncbi:MuF-like minor capsid protein [Mycobacterium phage Nairb]|uniref:MuF-like minor capsid protein n=5 Tax=Bernalvirus bernal13 TaxID=1982102 RepID=A0A2P1JRN1_9CAUD|nr:head maturation protease [Mycobacterium phage Bernal13]AIT13418.1 MuF-like minor capsid protein [Mycobacterium phage RonRayGun]ASJ79086.1 MuF-like minor capsid protein [Mycobacterium phage ZenTime222]AVO21793.1 MuF-like minor capsid protein [Mycobacterium phage Nairb]QBP28850.1 MuF-like minor capsid protein [Mycobacterium phage Ibrahim]QHB47411.1 MuF-like minor capsid protein [Mycobacterium phage Whitty]